MIPSISCFLLAYFESNGEEGLHLAWSKDGLKWHLLNSGASFLKPSIGAAKIMRDPHLLYGPDGIFHLVWTIGWEGQSIGYARSRDLKNWSPQRALEVMVHEPKAKNCWAPEAIWDEDAGHFLIFWSSTVEGQFLETENSNARPQAHLGWKRNHRIYSTTTRDWETFSPTRLHYDGGFNVIDAHMAHDAERGEWLMWVKNESFVPLEKNIRLVRASTLGGPFSVPSPPLTGNYWAEGPSALRRDGEWWVYFDKHQEGRYGLVCSRDLQSWGERSEDLDFPPHARHGSLLEVPRTILEPLLDGE